MVSEGTQRGRKKTEVGKVVSRAGNKSIVVEVTRRIQHPMYKRYVNRRRKFHVHDEQNQCRVGDWIRIAQARPLSRLKRWRFVEILQREAIVAAAEPVPELAEPGR